MYLFYYVTEESTFSDLTHIDNLENSRHPCPNRCGRHYKHKAQMARHLKFECDVYPQFKCPYCSKLSNRKSTLKRHVICVHNVILDDKMVVKSNNYL